MRRFTILLAAALLVAPVSGCLDPPGEEDPSSGEDGDGDQHTYEDCDALAFPEQGGWTVARIDCEANVPGEDATSIDCPEPEEAELQAGGEIEEGEVRLAVRDAAGETIAQQRLTGTDGEPRNVTIADGEPGEWTLAGERSQAFTGTYSAELACPT